MLMPATGDKIAGVTILYRILALALACLPLSAGIFEGRVVEDHNGNALSRVEIRITRPGAEAIVAELETDAQGHFRTPDLPDTPYLIRFSKTNFSTVEVSTPPRAGMQMRLIHFGAISGRVFHPDGSPVLDFQQDSLFAVTLTGVKAGTFDRNARGGAYRIYGLLPGRYRIVTTIQGILYQPNNSQPREFTIAGGEDYGDADISLPAGGVYTVSGKVEIAPPSVAQVAIVPVNFPSIDFGIGGETSAAFSIPRLFPGSYDLLGYAVRGDAHLFGRMPVTVSGGNIEGVVLPLNQSRSATLLLKSVDSCRDAVRLELTAAEPWRTRTFSAELRAGQPVTLQNMPPSKYAITATAAEGACFALPPPFVDLTRESPSKPVEVLLQPAGSIRGHMAGTGVVVLLAPDGAQQIALTDDKGQFAFANLRPGPYTLIAAGAETRWMPTADRMPPSIQVAPGVPTEVELPR